jgi:HTH-type transcriptional regulator/antitoxin MqsA
MSKQQCLLCGEYALEHKVKPMVYKYKSREFIIDQPAQWCETCGEGVINSEDNNKVVSLIQAEKSRIDGLLTPTEIKQVRQKLKLTQKDAAALFGGGINAFNRYEKGKLPVPRPLSQLLTLLGNHPNQLQELLN